MQGRKIIKSLMCKNKAAQDSVGCSGTVLYKPHHRSSRQQEKTPAGKTILLNTENRAKDTQVFNTKWKWEMERISVEVVVGIKFLHILLCNFAV